MNIPNASNVFEQADMFPFAKPFIDTCVANDEFAYKSRRWNWNTGKYEGERLPKYDEQNIKHFSKYVYRTLGNVFVKMLSCMENMSCSYHEIYNQILAPRGKSFGNDQLLFFDMERRGLMELDYLGKYKRRFFKLTDLGRLVLETAKKNNVAYKVLRHFIKLQDDFDVYMIQTSFNPETTFDVTPMAFVDMLDAIFDENGDLHKIGSYSYWCVKLLDSLKKNENFFKLFNCTEVNGWIDAHMSNPSVRKFCKVFDKIIKKHTKLAA